ncbi:MAG: pro-sigmaK processing inhibitor BofA family protein, partial [Acetatifactor sp.]|nr:pro-sigmaK processing inhibitor BofA family protein [Acetatifactor sp.]
MDIHVFGGMIALRIICFHDVLQLEIFGVISIAPVFVNYSRKYNPVFYLSNFSNMMIKTGCREGRMNQTGILLIMGICVVILLALAWRRRLEWLLNLVLRGVLGAVAIYFINLAVVGQGYP